MTGHPQGVEVERQAIAQSVPRFEPCVEFRHASGDPVLDVDDLSGTHALIIRTMSELMGRTDVLSSKTCRNRRSRVWTVIHGRITPDAQVALRQMIERILGRPDLPEAGQGVGRVGVGIRRRAPGSVMRRCSTRDVPRLVRPPALRVSGVHPANIPRPPRSGRVRITLGGKMKNAPTR